MASDEATIGERGPIPTSLQRIDMGFVALPFRLSNRLMLRRNVKWTSLVQFLVL